MDLHSGSPYWIIKNPLFDYFHPLDNDFSIEIAIIGSGITGALAANELCRAGFKCCVVDKRSISTGSSAASTALLQYEIDVPLYKMKELVGEQNAVTAYRSCLQSITDIESALKETGVDADFERLPSLFFASNEEGEELIKKEYEIRKKHQLPVELLNSEDLYNQFRLKATGALLNRESAQMDAYKAATGLLKYNMENNGLQVFTHTEIMNYIETKDGYQLKTADNKTISCKYLVIAAGFEAGRFLPRNVMQLTSTYALISQPVKPEQLWPERCLIWETNEPYLYIRTSNNRIIVGGEDEEFQDPVRRDELLREKKQILERKFHQLYPDIPFKTEMTWCGTFSTTKDGLPFIGTWPGKDKLFFDLGYGGNGITFSMIGAQIIRNMLEGKKDERAAVFGFERLDNL